MDIQEVRDKIEEYITKGQAEKAIAELVKYTKATKSPMHEDAILLSGQLKQWKRETMLGIQQSSNEVSRIKMGVLSIMKSLEQTPTEETPAPAPIVQQTPVTGVPTSPTKSSNNTVAILGGIGGLVLLLAVGWFLMNRGGEAPVEAVTNSTQPDSSVLIAERQSIATQTNNQEKNETAPATSAVTPPKEEPASTPTRTRTPSPTREVTLPEIVATVNCNGRTYKLGADNRVYDTTSSTKKIGTSTEALKCVDGILVAKLIPKYGGYFTYYNRAKSDWMDTMAEAKQ